MVSKQNAEEEVAHDDAFFSAFPEEAEMETFALGEKRF